MARLNIEEKWWTDPRRFSLAAALGDIRIADGLMIEAWKLSQSFWGNGRKKVPYYAFTQIKDHGLLFEHDLASKHGGFVYVCGTHEFHDWYASLKESSAKGGKSKGKDAKQIASESQADCKPLNSLLLPLSSSLLAPDSELLTLKENHMSAGADPKVAVEPEVIHKLIEIWNQGCGRLPQVKRSSSDRNRKIRLRWKDIPAGTVPEDYFGEVIKRIAASPFCNGRGTTGWVATFDWLLKPDSHIRVMEGKYDDRGGPMNKAQQVSDHNLNQLEKIKRGEL